MNTNNRPNLINTLKKYTLCIFTIALMFSCSIDKPIMTIEADIEGLGKAKIFLLISKDIYPVTIDSTMSENGKFTLTTNKIIDTVEAYLISEESDWYLDFIAEPNAKISIKGNVKDLDNVTIEGLKNEKVKRAFYAKNKELLDSIKLLNELYTAPVENEIGLELQHQFISAMTRFVDLNIEYVKSQPPSFYTFFQLSSYVDNINDEKELKVLMNKFSNKYNHTYLYKNIENKIAEYKSFKELGSIPDIKVFDTSDKSFNLHSLMGEEYTIVDFWASWCGPCIDELPKLRDLHTKISKYSRINIVSFSLDEEPKDWVSISKTLDIPWSNISDKLGFQESKLASLYKINSIPHLVLFDKNFQIVQVFKGGGAAEKVRDYLHL